MQIQLDVLPLYEITELGQKNLKYIEKRVKSYTSIQSVTTQKKKNVFQECLKTYFRVRYIRVYSFLS